MYVNPEDLCGGCRARLAPTMTDLMVSPENIDADTPAPAPEGREALDRLLWDWLAEHCGSDFHDESGKLLPPAGRRVAYAGLSRDDVRSLLDILTAALAARADAAGGLRGFLVGRIGLAEHCTCTPGRPDTEYRDMPSAERYFAEHGHWPLCEVPGDMRCLEDLLAAVGAKGARLEASLRATATACADYQRRALDAEQQRAALARRVAELEKELDQARRQQRRHDVALLRANADDFCDWGASAQWLDAQPITRICDPDECTP